MERILAFVGGPREARVPSFARMRFAHQTALRAAHRASRGVRAWQTRISSAVMLTLRIWKHLIYRLMLHGQEGQAELQNGLIMICKEKVSKRSHMKQTKMHPNAKRLHDRRTNTGLPSPDTARSAVSCAKRGLMREAHPSEARNPSFARAANES